MSVFVIDGPNPDLCTDLAARLCRDTGAFYRRYRSDRSHAYHLANLRADMDGPKLTIWDGCWWRDNDPLNWRLDMLLHLGGVGLILLDPHHCDWWIWQGMALDLNTWSRLDTPITDSALSAIYLGLEALEPKIFTCQTQK